MRLGFDIDGVVGDFVSLLSRKLKSKGYNVLEENYDRRYEGWSKEVGLTRPNFLKIISKVLNELNVNDMGLLDRRIPDYFSKMRARGNKIFFITHREKGIYDQTFKWLESHEIYHDGLYLVGDKKEVFKKLDLDFYVDDDVFELIHNDGSSVAKNVFLFGHSYNERDNINKVFSWEEIYNKIVILENEKKVF